MSRLLLNLIRMYRYLVSPWLGNNCRFEPSCSRYAYDAILKYGSINGVLFAIRRICRCNPWCHGGHDPVP